VALAATSLSLPPDLAEVRAGDVDGDGRDDLILVSRTPHPGAPATVRLTIVRFGADGAVGRRSELDLGSRPLLWDVDHGLWGIDGDGLALLDLSEGAQMRLARFPSVLHALGPTSPTWAPIAHDIDGDHIPELFAWSAGRWLGFRWDGARMGVDAIGGIPAPAQGAVDLDWSKGGASPRATLSPPSLAFGDLDGDKRADLLLPSAASLAAYLTGDTLGARATTLKLPLDLEPADEDPRPGETRRRVSAVWLDDLDGDGKTDLAVQRTVLNGSWFGATAELSWAHGRGDGFEALRTLPLAAAAFGVKLLDVDGDGDKDFVAPVVDIGLGTLARALVARSVRVDLSLFRMDKGQFQAPVTLRTFGFPVEQPDRLQISLDGDVDGDGRLDLVTNDGEDHVRVYRGRPDGMEPTAAWDVPMPVPLGDDTLFVHDLTGDKKAEIFVWGPKAATGTVLRAP
jgi:hypothetical protein